MGQMQNTIESKLQSAFSPSYIEVVDESHGHNVPEGAQSHFKVTMVSTVFEGLMAVKRHQKVYAELSEELAGCVHALALHLYTEQEWGQTQSSPESPNCMGGGK